MNPRTVQTAHAICARAAGSNALTGLGGQLRSTGLVRTFEWLLRKQDADGEKLADALSGALGLPRGQAVIQYFEDYPDRVALLRLHREALELTEAIDLVRRIKE